jgi:DNA-binding SARP family transcriptional activator
VAVPIPLRIELLGGFRLGVDGRPAARPPTARQQQLIALLILHARSAPIPRQRVGGSLWPESSDVQALTNLRRELHHLREGWPGLDALVDAGSRTLAWRDDAAASVDLVAFESAADRAIKGDRAAMLDAARLYKGDLLPECTGEWIEADRERLRQRAIKVLAERHPAEQDRAFGDAIERAQQLLRLDPWTEQAWCALMRHARATATASYQQCAAVLEEGLGVQPSAATRLTYRRFDLDDQHAASGALYRWSAANRMAGTAEPWHAAAAVDRFPRSAASRHRQDRARRG